MIYKERERTAAVEGEGAYSGKSSQGSSANGKRRASAVSGPGEEDDGDDWESDYEGVAGQESPGTPGRSGGVSLGDGNDAALGNGKDAASDGE